MATKRSIILRGMPEINEYGVAAEVITPGYLVKGVSSIALQTGSGWVPPAVALERDELGKGIDTTYNTGSSAGATVTYAVGDRVKVGVFAPGQEAVLYVASGQNISEDDYLESAGDGTAKEGTTNPIARAMETLGAVTVLTKLRVQFI